jgi:hypothetical protein
MTVSELVLKIRADHPEMSQEEAEALANSLATQVLQKQTETVIVKTHGRVRTCAIARSSWRTQDVCNQDRQRRL